jgi:hypothetical protein
MYRLVRYLGCRCFTSHAHPRDQIEPSLPPPSTAISEAKTGARKAPVVTMAEVLRRPHLRDHSRIGNSALQGRCAGSPSFMPPFCRR